MEYVHEDDDESKRRVPCTDDDGGKILGSIGNKFVSKLHDGAVPEAYQAMCDQFVGRFL